MTVRVVRDGAVAIVRLVLPRALSLAGRLSAAVAAFPARGKPEFVGA